MKKKAWIGAIVAGSTAAAIGAAAWVGAIALNAPSNAVSAQSDSAPEGGNVHFDDVANSSFHLPVGGAFKNQPSAKGGFITQEQALSTAREQIVGYKTATGVSASKATSAVDSAATWVKVVSYEEYAKQVGVSTDDPQLPLDATVFEVTINTPIPQGIFPGPPGSGKLPDQPQFNAAYDARTGLALSVGGSQTLA